MTIAPPEPGLNEAGTSSVQAKKRSWLSSPLPTPRLSDPAVARKYPKMRLQVFLGIFIGYAGFYLIRNNVSLVAAIFEEDGMFTKTDIGLIANAVLIAYGFSKFFMATVSDKSNARYFMPIGLALSAVANFAIAFIPALSATVFVFALVMFINGWVQGMGWPPSGRVLVQWFSTNERGWKTSIWNCAHNVGGMGVGAAASLGLWMTGGDWQSAFWTPAVFALIVAAIAFLLIRDNPEAEGLPSIEEYRNDPPKEESDPTEFERMSTWQIVLKHVILNPTMVFLALANVFIYALRYGVLSWSPIYLTQHHGQSVVEGIMGFSLFELAGIFGTLACGLISDKVFRGNRTVTGFVFMAGVGVFLVCYWLAPVGTPYWMLMVFLFFIGAFIYGPVMLIGLQAIDMAAKHVAGTSAGFTGLFGYVLGATLASSVVGILVDNFGWNTAFGMLLGCVFLAMVMLVFIYPREKMAIAHQKAVAAEWQAEKR
ncbi:MAG: MFS transporter [Propionibacteriaceae bacterium]|jgi:OPA family glycerol-3-phosphate transporter-like MFS transporter|nr:MFS transporter [Propionibacteriaceae bacterium]